VCFRIFLPLTIADKYSPSDGTSLADVDDRMLKISHELNPRKTRSNFSPAVSNKGWWIFGQSINCPVIATGL
jgi:hypothetical protein